jgi:hypothetical protein
MGRGSTTENKIVVPQAKNAMEKFKYEVANELGIQPTPDGYWGNLTSRDCGAVGGNMVRTMIKTVEGQLAGQGGTVGTTGKTSK